MNADLLFCECILWDRELNPHYHTLHHPACRHYADTLVPVWIVRKPGTRGGAMFDSEFDAYLFKCENNDCGAIPVEVVSDSIHLEVFNQLDEIEEL